MTIHHPLVHTSGIGHWDDMPEIDGTAPMEPAEEPAVIQGRPLRVARRASVTSSSAYSPRTSASLSISSRSIRARCTPWARKTR